MKLKELESSFEIFKKQLNKPELILYFADARCGRLAKIGYHNENGGLRSVTSMFTYDELDAFMEGYLMAINNPITIQTTSLLS